MVDEIWLRLQNLVIRKPLLDLVTSPSVIKTLGDDQNIQNHILEITQRNNLNKELTRDGINLFINNPSHVRSRRTLTSDKNSKANIKPKNDINSTLKEKHSFIIKIVNNLREFLDSKKQDILEGKFIPTKKNIVDERNEFEGYESYKVIVRTWLQKNTPFDSITDIKRYFKGISVPDQIRSIFNSKKNDILKGLFFPTKNNLGEINKNIKNYGHANDVINLWLKNNTQFENLTELIDYFRPNDYKLHPESLIDKLKKFLDSKKDDIIEGSFIPNKENIVANLKIFENHKIDGIVRRWLKKNTPFESITEILEHFYGTPEYEKFKNSLINFLDSKKEEISNGIFIPSKQNIIAEQEELKDYKSLTNIVKEWLINNTPFESITGLKERFLGKSLSKRLEKILDLKKRDILDGKFIPNTKNFIKIYEGFRGYDALTSSVAYWLQKNTPYKNLTDLIENLHGIPLFDRLKEFLDSRKEQILKGDFIPTTENIISQVAEFRDYKYLTNVVNRWINKNTPFTNLTQLRIHFKGKSIAEQLNDYLDLKKDDILNGKFFPTRKNLRKINEDFGNYEHSAHIVKNWLQKNSKGKFKNLESMISYFQPFKEELGQTGLKDYTYRFKEEAYRVKNAWYQIVRILNKNKLQQIDQKKARKTWRGLFGFLNQHKEWKLIDLVTGEIVTADDFVSNVLVLHHINGNKKDDREENLVFLLRDNHNIISLAQRNFDKLSDFFEKLLKKNLESLKKGKIPESWKVGWRELALNEGINLTPNRFKRKTTYNKILVDQKKRIKDMGEWVK